MEDEYKDPRLDPEVIKICDEMGMTFYRWANDGPAITMSVGDLAFFMRDKCIEASVGGPATTWNMELVRMCNNFTGGLAYIEALMNATPGQWVRAACKAWSLKNGHI